MKRFLTRPFGISSSRLLNVTPTFFAVILAIAFLGAGCAGTPPCDSCTTIAKNDTLIDDWINSIADSLDGARYTPGNPHSNPPTEPEITIPSRTSSLGSVLGTVVGVASSGAGKTIAKKMASEKIVCTPDELCEHCDPKPKISFDCGQACGENSQECENAADDCFDAMMAAAIGSHRNNKYTATRVKNAMKEAFNKTPECQKVKGIHAKCGEGHHTPGCEVNNTNPKEPGISEPSGSTTAQVNQLEDFYTSEEFSSSLEISAFRGE